MSVIRDILNFNRSWAESKRLRNPDFFSRMAEKQKPRLLWLGCSDARVGPDKLTGLPYGSIFVHRNIANIFATNDLNCLAVLEYAVDELRVPDIVVCGHYGCGGVKAALEHSGIQPIDLWLDQIRFIYNRHAAELDALDEEQKARRLCEYNVTAQVYNICRSTIVREAWKRGQKLSVHGLIYDMHNGLLMPMGIEFHSFEDWQQERLASHFTNGA
ncbi:MAG: carbonic anhydrase [Zetaproteobacteria bacterium]|nr:MAG: carbonic anhydrase [Zetaproteobacteria bacterium]